MFQYLMDQIIILYDISVWRIRDVVRTIEKVKLTRSKIAVFRLYLVR